MSSPRMPQTLLVVCVCVLWVGARACTTGMNGHSHLYVLSGSKVLAVKGLRTRAERQRSLCSAPGSEKSRRGGC